MRILAIETSCDETAIALVEGVPAGESHESVSGTSIKVLGNALYSQVETHAPFGGVFPMLAKREHAKNIVSLFASCITQAHQYDKTHQHSTDISPEAPTLRRLDEHTKNTLRKILDREDGLYEDLMLYLEGFGLDSSFKIPHIDTIAVTSGPGLEPTLWVGISFAMALGVLFDLPVLPINHMEGHIASILSPNDEAGEGSADGRYSHQQIQFPALALLISGGHTELVDIESWGSYKVIGRTKDDAVGEAFDKVARILGLAYPGGPEISKQAEEYRKKYRGTISVSFDITLPRPMLKTFDFDFSFSGLKTAVLYLVKDIKKKLIEKGEIKSETDSLPSEIISAIACEFENAVTEVLTYKTSKAIEQVGAKTLILGGGVVANIYIRNSFSRLIDSINNQRMDEDKVTLRIPPVENSTDNAVMIGTIACVRSLDDALYMQKNSIDTRKLDEKTQVSDLISADGNMSL